MPQITESQKQSAQKIFEKSAENMQTEQIEECIEIGETKMQKFKKHIPKVLLGLRDNIEILFSLVKDYKSKKYTEIPLKTIFAVVAALLYFFSPIDVIPDFIIGIGYIDDAFIIGLCLKSISSDLEKYKKRKTEPEN